MATKIKLEVNHSKHAKQESGQKITVPDNKVVEQNKQKQEVKDIKDSKQKEKLPQNGKKQPIKQKQSPKKQSQKNDPSTKQQKKSPEKPQKNESPKKQQKSPSKPDTELQTLERIKSTQKKTKLTIEQLLNQYKNAADDIFTNHGHNEEKEREIQRKLERLQKEKEERHRKLEKLGEISMNRSMRREKSLNQKEEKNQERDKERRRKRAERKLAALHALSQQRLKNEQAFKNYYQNEYKQKQFRYKKFQQQYKEKQKQYEQQIKQKLQKNSQKYQPMNSEQMADFLDEYEHNKWNMLQQAEKKREFNREVLESENKELMAKLWKGECHRRVKEERLEKMMSKNEGKTKLEKTREYGTMVKEEFKPKINQEKRNRSLSISHTVNNIYQQPLEVIDGKQYKKVAREKYANGVNQGLVIENLRKSLDHQQKIKKGNEYLQYLRSLPKAPKTIQQPSQQKPDQNPQAPRRKKTPSTTFKPQIQKNPYYENLHSDRIVSKSAAMHNEKRIKDPQLFHYMMADMKSRINELELEEKAIKYGRYNGILELQDRHSGLNRKLVQGISEKLNILGKM